MTNAAGKAATWGKRDQPDSGFDEVGRIAPDAGDSPHRMRSAESADGMNHLDTLPLDLHAELFKWLDARTCACIALCSSQLARRMRMVRRIEAGPLVEGGLTMPQARAERDASGRWLHERAVKLAHTRGWQNFSAEFCDFDADGRQALEVIGFKAGNRFLHVDGLRSHPAVLEGVARAPGWRSLSSCYTRRQLQSGIDALANAIAHGDPEMRRELSLRIFDCEEKFAFSYPEKFRLHRVDLVDLYLDQVSDPAEFLPCFNGERNLQSLEILIEQPVADAAMAVATIGNEFPELGYFRLVSYKPFGIAPQVWARFLAHRAKLKVLDLNHLHLGLGHGVCDFSLLRVSELVLTDFHLADPGKGLAAWIARQHQLAKLEIELEESALLAGDAGEAQVRDSLLEAIAINTSVTQLSLRGEAWMSGGGEFQPCDSFLSLMDSIISHPKMTSLQLPAFDIRGLDDFLNGVLPLRDSPLMDKLVALESLQPELRLTLGEFELEPIQYKTAINGNDAQLLRTLDGWPGLRRMPDVGEALEFKVRMRVWGDGAFRRFIKFCALRPDRQQRYLIGLANSGNLVEGSLKIVRVGAQ